MGQYLEWWWIFSIRFAGSSAAVWSRKIQNSWRPVVAFVKPPATAPDDWLSDCLEGGGREKDSHEWQQAESEAEYLIRKLTAPNDLVVDPFVGGGTIPVACKRLGRRWLATEIDPATAAVARQRVEAAERETLATIAANVGGDG
jgi:adenine-specific DNA methylase